MTDKSDILRQIDNIKASYHSGEYRMFANFDVQHGKYDGLL